MKIVKEFMVDDYKCVIIEHEGNQLCEGYYCGYVGIPQEHPLYGVKLFVYSNLLGDLTPEEYFDVHGGITYSGNGEALGLDSRYWWYGYDCGHAGDTKSECNIDFCTEECKSLARQLKIVEENEATNEIINDKNLMNSLERGLKDIEKGNIQRFENVFRDIN